MSINGNPVGVIGYGKFTEEEKILYSKNDPDLLKKIDEAVSRLKPESLEDMYDRLFSQ